MARHWPQALTGGSPNLKPMKEGESNGQPPLHLTGVSQGGVTSMTYLGLEAIP